MIGVDEFVLFVCDSEWSYNNRCICWLDVECRPNERYDKRSELDMRKCSKRTVNENDQQGKIGRKRKERKGNERKCSLTSLYLIIISELANYVEIMRCE